MPRGDRTGPNGMGPMTGRRAGFCAGYDMPGYANQMTAPRGGMGMGRGRGAGGGGRGWRNQFYATGLPGWARTGNAFYNAPAAVQPMTEVSKEQRLNILKQQASVFEEGLKNIQAQLKTLEAEKEEG